MNEFGLVVRFTLKSGTAAAFDALVKATVERVRKSEPGTLIYACHHVVDTPDQRIFYELYRDRAAFEEHEKQPHVMHFLKAREEFITGAVVDVLAAPFAIKATT
ncbi:putative quinol monooxygenase [Nonomuraea sp. NPDC050536]|uniref:putative quinol monooxygenase n=1 Tax=Nonomuraea sp. NPDC050536 TaxID=3364366 RepID=UPI0037CB6802